MADCLLSGPFFEAQEILHVDGGPLVLLVTGADAVEESENIAYSVQKKQGSGFSFVTLLVKDWNGFLTPWPDGGTFAGRGGEFLRSVSEELLPLLKEHFQTKTIYLAGYSLAGLFALWALYENPDFSGTVCCSGSLWYSGWKEYVESHHFQRPVRVFLSLGKKEEKAGKAKMRTVGENTRMTQEKLLADDMVKTGELLWHEGGHFNDAEGRMVIGICRILQEKQES